MLKKQNLLRMACYMTKRYVESDYALRYFSHSCRCYLRAQPQPALCRCRIQIINI